MSNAASTNKAQIAATELTTAAEKLSVSERVVLRGAAHALKPTVMVGKTGVTASVIAETQRALDAHQLIKIKLLSDDREERATARDNLCAALDCQLVQTIGKMLVLFKDDGQYVPPNPNLAKNPVKKSTRKAPHIAKKKLASLT